MPWQVAYTEQFDTKADALKRERQIKKWSRTKKDALVAGDMVELKKLAKRRKF
jgi:putative endonuclease